MVRRESNSAKADSTNFKIFKADIFCNYPIQRTIDSVNALSFCNIY